jgi:hypothetical protein
MTVKYKKKGGKITVNMMGKLLNESYKNKKNTSERVDNYELDKDLSTDKTKIYRDTETVLKWLIVGHLI